MTVLFRTDGSQRIGLGHISRCLALAQGLRKRGYEAVFLTRSTEEAIGGKIRAHGFTVHSVSPQCSQVEDQKRAIALARESDPPSIVVLDGYGLDAAYQRAVKEAGISLMVIDDLAQDHACADLVLNQNIYATAEPYSAGAHTRLLLGPAYALLREEFASWRCRSRPISERATRILVTLGGADPDNQTLKVVRAIASLNGEIETTVVLGAAYAHTDLLTGYLTGRQGHFALRSDVECMAELMHWADLAVSAGGGTCWELACLGVPNLVIALADDQRQNARGLAEAGISIDLGWWEEVSPESVADNLRQLIENVAARRKMSQAGKSLVDGHGVDKVVEAIREL